MQTIDLVGASYAHYTFLWSYSSLAFRRLGIFHGPWRHPQLGQLTRSILDTQNNYGSFANDDVSSRFISRNTSLNPAAIPHIHQLFPPTSEYVDMFSMLYNTILHTGTTK